MCRTIRKKGDAHKKATPYKREKKHQILNEEYDESELTYFN